MVTAVKDNLVEEIRTHGPKPAGPCAMVIFGITGDLSKRLLLPALYNLATHGLLNEHFSLAGFALSDISEEQLREKLSSGLKEVCGGDCNLETMHRLISGLRYISSDFEPAPGWQKLHSVFDEIHRTENVGAITSFTSPQLPSSSCHW